MERIRIAALQIMLKALKPQIPIASVVAQLGFEDADTCLVFLRVRLRALPRPLPRSRIWLRR